MENEDKEQIMETDEVVEYNEKEPVKPKRDYFLPASILISVLVLSGTWIYTAGLKAEQKTGTVAQSANVQTQDVAPQPPMQPQGGCGVDAGQTTQPRQQGGCGV